MMTARRRVNHQASRLLRSTDVTGALLLLLFLVVLLACGVADAQQSERLSSETNLQPIHYDEPGSVEGEVDGGTDVHNDVVVTKKEDMRGENDDATTVRSLTSEPRPISASLLMEHKMHEDGLRPKHAAPKSTTDTGSHGFEHRYEYHDPVSGHMIYFQYSAKRHGHVVMLDEDEAAQNALIDVHCGGAISLNDVDDDNFGVEMMSQEELAKHIQAGRRLEPRHWTTINKFSSDANKGDREEEEDGDDDNLALKVTLVVDLKNGKHVLPEAYQALKKHSILVNSKWWCSKNSTTGVETAGHSEQDLGNHKKRQFRHRVVSDPIVSYEIDDDGSGSNSSSASIELILVHADFHECFEESTVEYFRGRPETFRKYREGRSPDEDGFGGTEEIIQSAMQKGLEHAWKLNMPLRNDDLVVVGDPNTTVKESRKLLEEEVSMRMMTDHPDDGNSSIAAANPKRRLYGPKTLTKTFEEMKSHSWTSRSGTQYNVDCENCGVKGTGEVYVHVKSGWPTCGWCNGWSVCCDLNPIKKVQLNGELDLSMLGDGAADIQASMSKTFDKSTMIERRCLPGLCVGGRVAGVGAHFGLMFQLDVQMLVSFKARAKIQMMKDVPTTAKATFEYLWEGSEKKKTSDVVFTRENNYDALSGDSYAPYALTPIEAELTMRLLPIFYAGLYVDRGSLRKGFGIGSFSAALESQVYYALRPEMDITLSAVYAPGGLPCGNVPSDTRLEVGVQGRLKYSNKNYGYVGGSIKLVWGLGSVSKSMSFGSNSEPIQELSAYRWGPYNVKTFCTNFGSKPSVTFQLRSGSGISSSSASHVLGTFFEMDGKKINGKSVYKSSSHADSAPPPPKVYCAPGCYLTWIGDGYCDLDCYNADCNFDANDCTFSYVPGNWTACSCSGIRFRAVQCMRSDGTMVSESYCSGMKPSSSESCTTQQSCASNLDTSASTCKSGVMSVMEAYRFAGISSGIPECDFVVDFGLSQACMDAYKGTNLTEALDIPSYVSNLAYIMMDQCGANATNTTGACSAACPDFYIGDGECDDGCNVAACGWDGGDCSQCETSYLSCSSGYQSSCPYDSPEKFGTGMASSKEYCLGSEYGCPPPPSTTTTTIAFTYSYTADAWSSCSASCGGGTQTRSVTCQQFNPMNVGRRQLLQPGAPGSTPGAPGSVVSDSYCSGTKPSTSQSCNTQECYTYYYGTGAWLSCSASCGGGTQTRSVTCKQSDDQSVSDSYCSDTKPSTSQSCNTQECSTYFYNRGAWSSCSTSCGGGTQTRSVTCTQSDGQSVSDSYCSDTKPSTSQSCNTQECYTYSYTTDAWSSCSTSCGGGTQTRSVTCTQSDGQSVSDSYCSDTKPSTSQSCNTQACASSTSTTAAPTLTTAAPTTAAPTTTTAAPTTAAPTPTTAAPTPTTASPTPTTSATTTLAQAQQADSQQAVALASTVKLSGYTVSSFTNEARRIFSESVAEKMKVKPDQVIIDSVSASATPPDLSSLLPSTGASHRRAMLQQPPAAATTSGIDVAFRIAAYEDEASAKAAETVFQDVIESGSLADELVERGLDRVSISVVTYNIVININSPAPSPSSSGDSGGGTAAGAAGGAVAALIILGGAWLVRRRMQQRQEHPDEKSRNDGGGEESPSPPTSQTTTNLTVTATPDPVAKEGKHTQQQNKKVVDDDEEDDEDVAKKTKKKEEVKKEENDDDESVIHIEIDGERIEGSIVNTTSQSADGGGGDDTKKKDLKTWLAEHSLGQFEDKLREYGAVDVSDLRDLDDSELNSIGFKRLDKKRLKTALEHEEE
ncbi:papilin [Pycnococcus provasolii]